MRWVLSSSLFSLCLIQCSSDTAPPVCEQGVLVGMNCENCADGYQDNDGDGACLPTCLTEGMTCSGHGTCDDGDGTAACSCQIEYKGADCDLCADGFQDDDTNGTCEPMCTAWIKRRDITLTGAAQNQTNYQIKLTIPYSPAMQQDYDDLRFFTLQDESLPYWLESTSHHSAVVWVKVPSLPAGGTTCVLRYGNVCASSESDYASTFPWITELVENGDIVHTSIKVDSNEQPHISYRRLEESNYQLKYASRDDTKSDPWASEIVDGPLGVSTGKHSSLVLDNIDQPHISYFDETNYRLRYATWDGLAWSTTTVEPQATQYGGYCSIDLDSLGQPAISYVGGMLGAKYAHWNGTQWITEDVASQRAYMTSLKLDSHDVPHMAYQANTHAIKVATKNGTQWDIQQVDLPSDYNAIVLDSDDHPHLAYYDGSCVNLKYAFYDGVAWSIEIVKTIGGCQSNFVGLDLDLSGRPHISFEDKASSDLLGYATKDGSGWKTEQIDSQGGNDSSLCFDKSGFPHISHVSPDFWLKYTYRRKTATPAPTATLGEETTSFWKDP
jgi:hypothetical protein